LRYREVGQSTREDRRIYVSARAKCVEYQLSVDYQNAPIGVTDDFQQAVGSLPLVRDDNSYAAFINTYGTHFTSRVMTGAKMVVRSQFDEIALTRMEEQEVNVEHAAKLSFLRSAGALWRNTTSYVDRRAADTFERLRHSYTTSYLGVHPGSDGRWETWSRLNEDSSFPAGHTLAPLTALLTEKFFPAMPSDALAMRRDLLTAAYDRYCAGISGCEIPPPDRALVRMAAAVSRFLGSTQVTCPAGFDNLLSCGVLNVRTSGRYDNQRYAIPANSGSSLLEYWLELLKRNRLVG